MGDMTTPGRRTSAQNHQVQGQKSIRVKLGDNQIVEAELEILPVKIQVSGLDEAYDCIAVVYAIPNEFDCILGIPFFKDMQPQIDWRSRRIEGTKTKTLRWERSGDTCGPIEEGGPVIASGFRRSVEAKGLSAKRPDSCRGAALETDVKPPVEPDCDLEQRETPNGVNGLQKDESTGKGSVVQGDAESLRREGAAGEAVETAVPRGKTPSWKICSRWVSLTKLIYRPNNVGSAKAQRYLETDWDNFRDNPAFQLLREYKDNVFQPELPEGLPEKRDIEHRIDVQDPKLAMYRQQWRQSPEQQREIVRWVEDMVKKKLIRLSISPHAAPTFCVRKPVGWIIVHDYRLTSTSNSRGASQLLEFNWLRTAFLSGICLVYGNHVCSSEEASQAQREDPLKRRAVEEFQGTEAEVVQSTSATSPGLQPAHASTDRRSKFAVGGVLFQVVDGVERPISFTNRKMKAAGLSYPTQQQELLAIVHALAAFRIYCLDKPPIVESDQKSLEGLFTQKMANRRLARWFDILAEYHPTFSYLRGAKNGIADALNRRPDVHPETKFFHDLRITGFDHTSFTLAISKVTSNSELVTSIKKAYLKDRETQAIFAAIKKRKTNLKPQRERQHQKKYRCYSEANGLLWYRTTIDDVPRIAVPNDVMLRQTIISECHDSNYGGHPGVERTYLTLAKRWYWSKMLKSIQTFIVDCESCRRNKPRLTKPPGLLEPLNIPSERWQSISMDFITDLPITKRAVNSIWVVVDRLAKRCHFVPTTTKSIGTKLCMTVAHRAQGDGQTERMNRSLEEYLRCFVSPLQDDWDIHLANAEFAVNSTVNSSIKLAPFEADLGYPTESTPACS
ncbi:unnamed protein product [Phytophthora fragariaefolia]|uniref:Unnamed protein product n=1 Tax=Phytophthora fragariaefolia TaxID=1490495 RepID=A0A9W6Y615_9STRA|nr:unnamed protein product [Phytophthora fragariaefolia]